MRVWAFAVARWQFTLVLFMLLIALGAVAVLDIPRSEDPNFPIPVSTVIVNLPGADPLDIERLVVDPIEDALAELDDIKEIRSTSRNGSGVIQLEFDWDTDPEAKHDEVVREINGLRGSLPEGIRSIELRKSNPSLVNIVQFALVDNGATPLDFKRLAEDLEDLLETVPGIRRAETWAIPRPEVRVALDPARLAQSGVDVATVVGALRGEGANIPGGAIDIGSRRYNLKTTGDYESIDEIRDTVLTVRNGSPVRVRDVAEAGWAIEEQRYRGRYNGRPAAWITANMQDGADIFAVQRGIDARIAAFREQLPATVELVAGFVQATNVRNRLDHLGRDFLIALALVGITLLPLGLRAAGIVAIAIPLSLAMGLAGLWALGFTLNQMSIAGFVVALGLLVDDAIVVVENVSRHMRDGATRVRAAIDATGQISLAVLGCTAALLLAFLPLLSLPEGAGKFTRGLPLAVVLTVLASLFVALTIIPFLASVFLPKVENPAGNRSLRLLQGVITRVYAPVVNRALTRPRTALLLAFGPLAASLLLVPGLGFSLFPAADKPQFLITINGPEGASLKATDAALRMVETELLRHPEVRHVMANLGKDNPYIYYNEFARSESPDMAQVFVGLERWDGKRSERLLQTLRERFDQYPDARIVVSQFRNGPPIEAPLAVRIFGPDLMVLRELAGKAEQIIKQVEGTRDVVNPLRLPRIDLDLGIDTDKANLLGLGSEDADRTIRAMIAGQPAATFRDQLGDSYDITVRLPIGAAPTLALLDDIRLSPRGGGESVPLAQVADPHLVSAPERIQRRDRERLATLTGYFADGATGSAVTASVYEALAGLQLPRGYRIVAGGEAEAASSSFGGLGAALLVAALGIVAVLVLEFGSFRSTLIVAGVVPFGILGALLALYVTGQPLSYMAIIGFVALTGVEIKNSILLVDFTNQLRQEGMPLDEAIERAGELRFLPVLLTSATAIGGLLPLAVAGSAVYAPLAIVMIGGLCSSTLLARIVTPVMYKLLPPALSRAPD